MKFGQISNAYKKYSNAIDYLQFDICGLSASEASTRLSETLFKNPNIKSIILHSDWTKKGCSENNFPSRKKDYIDIYNELSKRIPVIGITLHPMFRSKISLEDFLVLVTQLEEHMDVFIENRSNSKILISQPNEIIDLSHIKKMTIDIPQLLISCGYSYEYFLEVLKNINWTNVKEIHLANIKKDGTRTYVGRSLDDGIINIKDITHFLTNKLVTLEILGGANVFNNNISLIKENL